MNRCLCGRSHRPRFCTRMIKRCATSDCNNAARVGRHCRSCAAEQTKGADPHHTRLTPDAERRFLRAWADGVLAADLRERFGLDEKAMTRIARENGVVRGELDRPWISRRRDAA
jgi:hypothetical protein